jgi:hypothetical protein
MTCNNIEVFSRVVGYYSATKQWNKGKKEEFKDRKTFKIEDDMREYTIREITDFIMLLQELQSNEPNPKKNHMIQQIIQILNKQKFI